MNELLVHHQDHVATIVFNRPQKKNALTLDMFVRLAHILDELEQDPEATAPQEMRPKPTTTVRWKPWTGCNASASRRSP